MQFDIITIFPKIFDSYFKESFIKKAQEKALIKINVHDLRDYAKDKHKKIAEVLPNLSPRSASPRSVVDDRPFGGGLGMVLKVEPIYQAVSKIKLKNKKTKIVLFTPRGKKFNQKKASQFLKLDQLIMICGRYEGVDERVAKKIADIELSIGDYDLMGGELAAMIVLETTTRLIPNVLGKPELLDQRITKEKCFIEYPQYTRPETFKPKKGEKWKVPSVLISGNHKKIGEWRQKRQKNIGHD
jgi:tRNA (guanine37-N1)-methyltransferase